MLRDISQAYVQSDSRLSRDFVVTIADICRILVLDDDKLLRVLKPLYGMLEAGNHGSEPTAAIISSDCR